MTDEPSSQDVDDLLTTAFGIHGPWVLAIETFDAEGERSLLVRAAPSSTRWTDIGLAYALQQTISNALDDGWREGEDD